MKVFGDPNDRFHHIWEAAATASTLLQRMIDFCRHDELPGVGIQKGDDRLFQVLFCYQVTVAYKHISLSWLTARRRAVWLGFAVAAAY